MSIQLRDSRALTKLRAGEVVKCVKINLADPRVIEIAALAGFDCVWVDLEHVPNTLRDIENGIRAAKAYGCDTLVRVPRGSYSDLIRPLEMDASGIMVPHVMNGQDAAQIAHHTRFHPVGLRALDGGNADGAYTMVGMSDYIAHANQQRLVVVQIEDPEALDDIDQIAATPGLDMLFFGPGDFSQAIGHPGEGQHPKIAEARRLVAEAAARHGKFAGTVTSAAGLKDTIAMGYRFISVGADVVALARYFKDIVGAFGSDDASDEASEASQSVYADKAK